MFTGYIYNFSRRTMEMDLTSFRYEFPFVLASIRCDLVVNRIYPWRFKSGRIKSGKNCVQLKVIELLLYFFSNTRMALNLLHPA